MKVVARNNNQAKVKHTSAAENRFRRVMFKLRGMRWNPKMDKKTQEDISYLVHGVTMKGFDFFPNHYVMDEIIELEQIEKRLSV